MAVSLLFAATGAARSLPQPRRGLAEAAAAPADDGFADAKAAFLKE